MSVHLCKQACPSVQPQPGTFWAISANLVSEALQCARTRALFCFLPVMGLCCTATCSERTQKHRKTSVQTIPMPKSKVDQTKNIGSLSSALTRCTDSGIWSPKDLDTENTSFSRCFSLLPASELRLNCFSDVILREKADPLLHGHIARLPSAGLR